MPAKRVTGASAQLSFEFEPRLRIVTWLAAGRLKLADEQRLDEVANGPLPWKRTYDGHLRSQVGPLDFCRYRTDEGVAHLIAVDDGRGCWWGSSCYGSGMVRRALQRLARDEASGPRRQPPRSRDSATARPARSAS